MTEKVTDSPSGTYLDSVTIEELEHMLRDAHVPLDTWGQGSARTLQHLFNELQEGEIRLAVTDTGEIERYVGVVLLDIYGLNSTGEQFRLVEDRQEFKDGRIRRRALDSSLGEKVKGGEAINLAAARALREELGITEAEVQWLRSEQVDHVPMGYPGLKSHYAADRFSALLSGEAFAPEGYVEEQADKTNFYVWVPCEEPA